MHLSHLVLPEALHTCSGLSVTRARRRWKPRWSRPQYSVWRTRGNRNTREALQLAFLCVCLEAAVVAVVGEGQDVVGCAGYVSAGTQAGKPGSEQAASRWRILGHGGGGAGRVRAARRNTHTHTHTRVSTATSHCLRRGGVKASLRTVVRVEVLFWTSRGATMEHPFTPFRRQGWVVVGPCGGTPTPQGHRDKVEGREEHENEREPHEHLKTGWWAARVPCEALVSPCSRAASCLETRRSAPQ